MCRVPGHLEPARPAILSTAPDDPDRFVAEHRAEAANACCERSVTRIGYTGEVDRDRKILGRENGIFRVIRYDGDDIQVAPDRSATVKPRTFSVAVRVTRWDVVVVTYTRLACELLLRRLRQLPEKPGDDVSPRLPPRVVCCPACR